MTLTRDHGLRLFAALVLIAAGIWIAANTEWVDVDVPNRPNEASLRDPDRQLKQILTRLGARVVTPQNLDALPPPGATLLLRSWQWDLFPQRRAALQRWVENGGHLVLPNFGVRSDDGLAWVPLQRAAPKPATPPASQPAAGARDTDEDDDDDNARPQAQAASTPASAAAPNINTPADMERERCRVWEPASVTPAFGVPRSYEGCAYANATLRATATLQWALDGPRGHYVARVAIGRGLITATPAPMPWANDAILERDNALIAVATLRARPGAEIWIVTSETRTPLLAFLWERGTPAVLLGLLALTLALWRGAVRFGPPVALAPRARRSVVEQIRGTAAFVAQHGGAALHAAQLRALGDVARTRLRGYDTMIVGERAQAIADATGLDAHALARALNPALAPALRRHPASALALLESARRRLLNRTPASPLR